MKAKICAFNFMSHNPEKPLLGCELTAIIYLSIYLSIYLM